MKKHDIAHHAVSACHLHTQLDSMLSLHGCVNIECFFTHFCFEVDECQRLCVYRRCQQHSQGRKSNGSSVSSLPLRMSRCSPERPLFGPPI